MSAVLFLVRLVEDLLETSDLVLLDMRVMKKSLTYCFGEFGPKVGCHEWALRRVTAGLCSDRQMAQVFS